MEKEDYLFLIRDFQQSLMAVRYLLESNKIITAYNRINYFLNKTDEILKKEEQNGKEN